MNTKIARLDSRRDTEAIDWADELRKTEAWFQSPRFQEITRLHTAFEVVALRGNTREDHTVARESAVKMYDYLQRLFREKLQEITYGPFSPTGAVRAVMEGIKVLYLGGWSTSARAPIRRTRAPIWRITPWIGSPKKAALGCVPCCIRMKCKDPTE